MARRVVHSGVLTLLLVLAALIPGAGGGPLVGAQSSGTTFTSPTYGYTLAYDASWVLPAHQPQHDQDTLLLTNGLSSVAATAGTNFAGNAQRCLDQTRTSFSQAPGVSGVQPTGSPSTSTGSQAQSADNLTFTPSGGTAVSLTLYLHCQTIAPGQTTLLLEAITPQDAATTQAAAIAALFGSVQQPSSANLPSSVPSATVTPVPLATLLPLPVGAAIAVTNDGVNLRAQPSTGAQVVTVLPAGAALTVAGPEQSADGYTWSPVTTSDGTQGYVASQLTGARSAAAVSSTGAPQSANSATTAAPAAPSGTDPGSSSNGNQAQASTAGNAPGDTYTNVDGNQVQRPIAAPAAPAGATAQCVDGTYSFSQHHQGTCSHHGGVAQWLQ